MEGAEKRGLKAVQMNFCFLFSLCHLFSSIVLNAFCGFIRFELNIPYNNLLWKNSPYIDPGFYWMAVRKFVSGGNTENIFH